MKSTAYLMLSPKTFSIVKDFNFTLADGTVLQKVISADMEDSVGRIFVDDEDLGEYDIAHPKARH